jgi:hypothetical protein
MKQVVELLFRDSVPRSIFRGNVLWNRIEIDYRRHSDHRHICASDLVDRKHNTL